MDGAAQANPSEPEPGGRGRTSGETVRGNPEPARDQPAERPATGYGEPEAGLGELKERNCQAPSPSLLLEIEESLEGVKEAVRGA